MKNLIVLILILFTVSIHAKKIYKWVDEDGKIHYSSTKPQDQQTETVRIRKAPSRLEQPPADETTAEEQSDESAPTAQETVQNAQDEAAAQAQQDETDRINRQQECNRARANLNTLNATFRVTRQDPETGEVVRMTDDERVAALARAQELIRTNCR